MWEDGAGLNEIGLRPRIMNGGRHGEDRFLVLLLLLLLVFGGG
jgi:hypothetical protein